jgi:hypothetical protein
MLLNYTEEENVEVNVCRRGLTALECVILFYASLSQKYFVTFSLDKNYGDVSVIFLIFWLSVRTEIFENSGMSFRKIVCLKVLLQFVDTYQLLL